MKRGQYLTRTQQNIVRLVTVGLFLAFAMLMSAAAGIIPLHGAEPAAAIALALPTLFFFLFMIVTFVTKLR